MFLFHIYDSSPSGFPIVVILEKFISLITGYTIVGYSISHSICSLLTSFIVQFLFTLKVKITEELQFICSKFGCPLPQIVIFLLHA